ncbi:MAG: tripartite tricarboxylate transporter TctB family protein [Aquisalimonadaceae bacterium]
MSNLRHRLTAAGGFAVSVGLTAVSFSPARPMGYEFPQMTAVTMLVIAAALLLLAFKPGKPVISSNEESIPWRAIWPLLLVLVGFLLIAGTLGYFATSLIAFFLIVLIYSPGPLSWRRAINCGLVSAVFMGVLYLIFVALLNVQVPRGILL